ncbi:MAG: dihydropteroate synthase, partial [Muribaculaceae bacterium]|nr:dihydropteroate synthase [Muribaculaceae bacterium]
MYHFTPYNLTLRGSIVNINEPWVMGILNLTPDSFYSDSRCNESTMIEQRVNQIITEGAKIIDIGGYS